MAQKSLLNVEWFLLCHYCMHATMIQYDTPRECSHAAQNKIHTIIMSLILLLLQGAPEKMLGGNTDNVTLFLDCNLKLASTTEFHAECNSLHYNETAKHCGVTSLLPAGCYIHCESDKISL